MSEELSNVAAWEVILEGEEDGAIDDIHLKFIDSSKFLGNVTIEKQLLDSIIKLASENDHYSIFKNLKKILSDTGDDVTALAICALMGVAHNSDLKLGFLLGVLSDMSLNIIGVWPSSFADQLRVDPNIFQEVVDTFIFKPDFWDQVELILGYD